MPNSTDLVVAVLAIAVTIERFEEVLWILIEGTGFAGNLVKNDAARYKKFKEIVSLGLSIVLGFLFSSAAPIFGVNFGNDPNIRLVVGIIAGVLAPYSHQLMSVLFQAQQLFKEQSAPKVTIGQSETHQDPASGSSTTTGTVVTVTPSAGTPPASVR